LKLESLYGKINLRRSQFHFSSYFSLLEGFMKKFVQTDLMPVQD